MMVLQLFHQADLCLLFNRFMGRAVFAYTECVVCPNEFHRNLHQSCHTYGRFHIVREYEECTASSNDTAVEHHTDAAAGHGQLATPAWKNAPLKSPEVKACVFFRKPSVLSELERSAEAQIMLALVLPMRPVRQQRRYGWHHLLSV